ncbi:MAG: SDR family oxidoreductase [Halodesulfurarchaeum sp.]
MTRPCVLVVGATGTVGRHVVTQLDDDVVDIVAATRKPESATDDFGEAVSTVEFDFTRPETWGGAFDGVDRLFLLRPPGGARIRRDIAPAIDAAVRCGVSHVVFLSVRGAARIPVLPHRRIERHLEQADVSTTFLRADFFMQNLLEVHRRDIVEHDQLFIPAGAGKTAFVDARDVAAVGATALAEPATHSGPYQLTGPEALDYWEVAHVASDVLGRDITYAAPGGIDFLRRMSSQGHSLRFVAVMIGLYLPTRLGLTGPPTDTVESILDRPPRSVRRFFETHADDLDAVERD